mgnify:CR=1 FL=1
MTKIKIFGIGILAVVLAVIITLLVVKFKTQEFNPVGAPGNMLAENYDPYLKYNGGFNTELGITNSGGFTQSGSATLSGATTLSGANTLSGTTTMTKSPDGFVAYMGFTMATGTAKAVYTNPSSDLVCDGRSGYFQGVGTTFAPSLVVAFGTSTSATGYSTNLLASTTLATTTNQFFAETFVTPFRLKSGESIVGALSDITNSEASSTNYSNWSMQYGVHCWVMGS